MEKIVVSDTNIFIDLISVDLLTDFFKLPWEIHTTDMIIHELLIAEQQEAIRVFEEEGRLLVKKHSSKEMVELAVMRMEASKLLMQVFRIAPCGNWLKIWAVLF